MQAQANATAGKARAKSAATADRWHGGQLRPRAMSELMTRSLVFLSFRRTAVFAFATGLRLSGVRR